MPSQQPFMFPLLRWLFISLLAIIPLQQAFASHFAPLIGSPTSDSITSTGATLGGDVTSDNGFAVMDRGVIYSSTDVDPFMGALGVTVEPTTGTTGVFTIPIAGLTPGTVYYYKAYATSIEGTNYTSPVSTFTTDSAPTVTSPTSADITSNGVTLGGNVTSDNGDAITERGVVYSLTGTNDNPEISGSGVIKVTTTGTTGEFTVPITGLGFATEYSYKAYAINTVGTTYSAASTFITLPVAPTVTSPTSTLVTSSTATLGGDVTQDGGGEILERGVVYSITTINGDPEISGTGVSKVTTTGNTGLLSVPVTGLAFDTDYTYKAYATNSAGTTYTSPVASFTTLPVAPFVSSPTSTLITSTAVTLGGNVTNDGGEAVTERGIVYSITDTNGDPEISGTGVTKVTTTGTTGVLSVPLTSLVQGTVYSFKVYAINSVGTTYSSVSTFTTLIPVVTAILPPNGTTAGGTAATIVGSGFTDTIGVTIGGVVVTSFTVVNDSMINVTTAARAAGLVDVVVTSSLDSTGGEALYTYGSAPVPAGATWLEQPSAGSGVWVSVTSSADGSKLAAVDYFGGIWTSTDAGVNWTEQASAASESWISITSSADGTKLAATVSGGNIWTSTDSGLTWTEQTSSGSRAWGPITSSSDGTKLAAIVDAGGIWTSADSGVTWTEQTSAGNRDWRMIDSSADGSKLAAVVLGGNIWTSTDSGATWTAQTSAGSLSWRGITSSADGSKLAAVEVDGSVWTSIDSGANWTEQLSAGTRAWINITSSADGSKLAAVVNNSTIWTSTDSGSTWTEQTSAGSQFWWSIASSADGSMLIAGVSGGGIWTSPNRAPLISLPTSGTLSSTGATVGGKVTSENGSTITERGVVYSITSINGNPILDGEGVTKKTGTGTVGVFTVPLTGLAPGTAYSFKAYATNSYGTNYTSPVSSFTTLATAPTVTSPTSASIASTTATLGGNVTKDNGAAITERGVVYSLTTANSNPLIGVSGVTKVIAAGTTGEFTVNITGLTAGKSYSFKAYAINSKGTTYTAPVSTFATSVAAPTVTTPTSASITSSTATIGGNVTKDGGVVITERGVVYSSTDADPEIGQVGVTKVTSFGTTGVFTVAITGLVAGTEYAFKAYAKNSAGTTYTSVASFTTLATAPKISSPTKTLITSSNATIGGNVTLTGGAAITARGVVYSLTASNSNPLIGGLGVTQAGTFPTTGVFAVGVSNLSPGKTYSFKAYATNSVGTSYTAVSTFTTLATAPTVTSPTKAGITATAATIGGNVTNSGGGTITQRGVVYSSTNGDPEIGDLGVTSKTNIGTTGAFTIPLTGLAPGTEYAFKAYAINSAGTSYSSVSTFTTLVALPTVTAPTKASITTSGALVGGNVTKDGGADITERGVVYSLTATNGDPKIGGTGVTKQIRAGTIGVFTTSLTGLAPGKKYSFKAYATNSKGTAYSALASFTTLATAPTVTTPTKSSIAARRATLGGKVTKDNGAVITERGVVYSSTNEDPEIDQPGVTKKTLTGTIGAFTIVVSGLDPATEYFFKAYAINSKGTTYTSPVSSFTTLVAPPTINTPTMDAITSTNAKLGGKVTEDGGATITERGVVYSKSAVNPNPKVGGTGVKKAVSIGTTGVFTINVSSLLPGTKYSFKAFATNSKGTSYTTVSTFTTPSASLLASASDTEGFGLPVVSAAQLVGDTSTTIDTIDPTSGLKYLTIVINKAPGTEQQTRVVEVSSNLTDWFSGSNHTTVLSDDAGILKVRDNTPATQGTKRYIRLKTLR